MAASRPGAYGLAHFFRSCYQSRTVAADFPVREMTAFQALLAGRLALRIKEITDLRQQQGLYLAQRLKNIEGASIPDLPEKERYNFTRFPVLVKNAGQIALIQQRLWKERGIETSRLYEKPLHHMFDLGYRGDDFPNACFLADHLLTFPVHAFVSQRDLEAMVDIVSRVVKG
jgi:dTDP-4-amino-4,6-dideoxygalactose transaminase